MDACGLLREEQCLARGLEGVPARAMSPVSDDEAAPSARPQTPLPLVVDVCVEFTDPIIRSQYSRSYSSSQTLVPTDRVCEAVLGRLGHCCEELMTQKDARALERCHEVTLAPKRRRYGITFTIFRQGSPWAERTFKSYQRQPLTVNFTNQVITATHEMVENCLGSCDKDDRCLSGPLHPGRNIPTPPLSPSLEAMDAAPTGDGLVDLLSRTNHDSDVRQLELQSPTWSVREPLDLALELSACRPTIETTLERGNTGTVKPAADAPSPDDQLREPQERPRGDVAAQTATGDPSPERTLPRHFLLHNRSSRSLITREDLAPRNVLTHSRTVSAAVSIQSERGTKSSPRVFPLVPRRYAESSRRNTISALSSGLGDALPSNTATGDSPVIGTVELPAVSTRSTAAGDTVREKPRGEDILPNTEVSGIFDHGLFGPYSTAPVVNAVEQSDSENTTEETAVSGEEPKFGLGSPIILARDPVVTTECAHSSADPGPIFSDNDVKEPTELETRDVSGAMAQEEEQETASALSTPALSAGSDSSPRHSVIWTPTMNILAVSNLEYAKEEPSSLAEEGAAQEGEEAPFRLHDFGRADGGETAPVAEHSRLRDDDQEDSEDDANQSIVEEASMIQLPSSPPMPAADDLDPELLEASMIELPSSPTLGLMDETRMRPEETTGGNACESTFYLDSSMLEDDQSFDSGTAEATLEEQSADAVSMSETVRPYPAEVELPPSPETAVVEHSISPESLDTPAPEDHRTSWYNEDSSVLFDDLDVLPDLPSSPAMSSTGEDDHLVVNLPRNAELEGELCNLNGHVGAAREAAVVSPLSETVVSHAATVQLPLSPDPGVVGAHTDEMDISVDAPLERLAVGVDFPLAEVAHGVTTSSDEEEQPQLPTSPAGEHTAVQVQGCSEDEGEATSYLVDHVDHGLFPSIHGDHGKPEEASTETPTPDPTTAQLPPFPETRAVGVGSGPEEEHIGVDEPLPVEHISTGAEVTRPRAEGEPTPDLEDNISHQTFLDMTPDPAAMQLLTSAKSQASEQDLDKGISKMNDEPNNLEASDLRPSTRTGDVDYSSEAARPAMEHRSDLAPVDVDACPSVAETVSDIPSTTSELDEEEVLELESPASLKESESDIPSTTSELDEEEVRDLDSDEASITNGQESSLQQEAESDIPSTISEVDEEEVRELDGDALSASSGHEPGLQEGEAVLSHLNMDAAEARARALSNASDLPSLFPPAISDWLATSDHMLPGDAESVQDAGHIDIDHAAVLDQPVAEAGTPDSTFLAAKEIPDPFDHVRPDDSVSRADSTEDEQGTAVLPHTPRRHLTFPIPTPFSLRTNTFSASPPSPAVSASTSSPRPSIDVATRNSVDTVSLGRNSVDTIDPSDTSPNPRDSVDTIAPLPSHSPPSSPHADHRPSTAGWLGVRGSATRRFSMPLQHVWDATSSERGSQTSRPGTPTSTATVRYASYKGRRGERRRPRLSDLAPRPGTSGGVLESVSAEEHGFDGHSGKGKKGVASRFVMLFAGVEFAKRSSGLGEGEA